MIQCGNRTDLLIVKHVLMIDSHLHEFQDHLAFVRDRRGATGVVEEVLIRVDAQVAYIVASTLISRDSKASTRAYL